MINENLRKLRIYNKYTQEDIAEKLGVSRQSVAKWENGESIPDINKCMELAKLYDVTLDAINTFNIKFLIPVGIGVLIGVVLTTKIIEKLIKKYPGKTYMMILGFVGGSIIAIYPSCLLYTSPSPRDA